MVRISTEYDKELHEKVFLVRGDEAYARTTDTVVTINTYTNSANSIEGYRIGLTINVLRAVGNSSVVVYDDDKVLGVYDWTGSSITIGSSSSGGFLLKYGVDHPIYVKFLGNSQCLPSKSKVQTKNYTLPNSFKTEITFQNTNQSINENATYTSNITLTMNGSSSSYLYSTDIIIYVDGVALDNPITTGESSNVASLTLSNLSKGLHTITAEVIEGTNVHGATTSTNVSVGYDIKFTTLPSKIYNGENNIIIASINDYFGTIINSGTAYLKNTSGTNLTSATISNNSVSFNYNGNSTTYKVTYGGSSTDTVTLPVTGLNDITISGWDYTAKGYSIPLTISVLDTDGNKTPDTTITLTNTNSLSTTVTANGDGDAIYNYVGTGVGDLTFTATHGSYSKTKSIKDYLQYWELENTENGLVARELNLNIGFDGVFSRTSQGYKFTNGDLLFIYNSDMLYFEVEFVTKSSLSFLPIFKSSTTTYTPTSSDNFAVTNGKTVKLEVLNGDYVKVYVDGSLKKEYTYSMTVETNFAIRLVNNTQYLNNIKVKKL